MTSGDRKCPGSDIVRPEVTWKWLCMVETCVFWSFLLLHGRNSQEVAVT